MPRTRPARRWQIRHADCLKALPKLPTASIDAVITDPPYGIGINSISWDRPTTLNPVPGRRKKTDHRVAFQAFCAQWTGECLRVLKPGAHLASFASPRTAHLLACGLEEAGFELRDMLMWIHSQGFPQPAAIPRHKGWGPGLRPNYEPILLARKPLQGTLEQNLTQYGTGALHIDACRTCPSQNRCTSHGRTHPRTERASAKGRWPGNIAFFHHQACTSHKCNLDCAIRQLGERHRFYYCAKPNHHERNAGCGHLPRRTTQTFQRGPEEEQKARAHPVANIHPTVKPIELMCWLVRLLTPQDGLVLDPFTGSGSTGAAAVLEGARFHGIEREHDYIPIAKARIKHWGR